MAVAGAGAPVIAASSDAGGAEKVGSPLAIDVSNLRVRYRRTGNDALSGLNLRVQEGETVALIGTNGSGKSTLLRCLVRLVEPADGTISLGSTTVTKASRRALRGSRSDVRFG